TGPVGFMNPSPFARISATRWSTPDNSSVDGTTMLSCLAGSDDDVAVVGGATTTSFFFPPHAASTAAAPAPTNNERRVSLGEGQDGIRVNLSSPRDLAVSPRRARRRNNRRRRHAARR